MVVTPKRRRVGPAIGATVSVTVKMTVNLGNYESATAEVGLAGLPADATEEDINVLLATGKVAYERMKVQLAAKIADIKKGRG